VFAAFVVGVHHAIAPTRYGLAGILFLLASCIGLVVAGLSPWINVNGVPTETPSHVAGAIMVFLGASTGLMILSRRMAADAGWRSLSGYVLATGILMAGLLQRILVAVWFACMIVIARRALRISRRSVRL
jgi:hypothetical protein